MEQGTKSWTANRQKRIRITGSGIYGSRSVRCCCFILAGEATEQTSQYPHNMYKTYHKK